jgi:homoserine dehydrogenase
VVTDELEQVTGDPRIQVVAHLVGGVEPARTIMLRLLESGKDVVTANKALLAEHGPELFDRARELGRSIAFDASVAGGIPIITNIGQCLSANQITSLRGILNGTTNFMISQMEDQGASFAEAVREAQRRGFAEADPTLDVDGSDAAQKLAILAHLAFGARIEWAAIPRVGIDRLDPADLRYARELGYRIKLLASAELSDGGLELGVAPTLVRAGRPLAEVREANNAISVVGDAVGRVFFHGLGAGQMPTASAVVADMIDTAVGRTQITFRTLELWSRREARVGMADHDRVVGRNYLRFTVDDHPGVLADIAGILGRQRISIASVIQHEPESEETAPCVPLVIMTHRAAEGAAREAVAEIDRLSCIRQASVRMRVLD